MPPGGLALLSAAPLPSLPALPDAAALADLADPAGLLDPPPTVSELAVTTGQLRIAVRWALSVLVAAGFVTVGDGVARLTLPSDRPDTVPDEPDPEVPSW